MDEQDKKANNNDDLLIGEPNSQIAKNNEPKTAEPSVIKPKIDLSAIDIDSIEASDPIKNAIVPTTTSVELEPSARNTSEPGQAENSSQEQKQELQSQLGSYSEAKLDNSQEPTIESPPKEDQSPAKPLELREAKNDSGLSKAPTATASAETIDGKKKKSKVPLIIAIVAGFLLISGGVSAGSFYYIKSQPEVVLADVLANVTDDVTAKDPVASKGSFTLIEKGKQNKLGKVVINFDAATAKLNSSAKLDIKIEYDGKSYALQTESAVFTNDKELYFRLNNLQKTIDQIVAQEPEAATILNAAKPIIQKIDGQWVKVTQDDVNQYAGVEKEKLDRCEEALKTATLSGDDKRQLKKLFRDNQFMVAGETLKSEKINDVDSFHYKLDFNDEKSRSFTKKVINLDSFNKIKKDCEITDKDIDNGFDEAGNEDNSYGNYEGYDDPGVSKPEEKRAKPIVELWVGKWTRRPTKFRVTAKDRQADVNLTANTIFEAENVSIKKPSGAITFEQLQADIEKSRQEIFGPSVGSDIGPEASFDNNPTNT